MIFFLLVLGFFCCFFLASSCRVPEEDVLRPHLAGAGGTQHPARASKGNHSIVPHGDYPVISQGCINGS